MNLPSLSTFLLWHTVKHIKWHAEASLIKCEQKEWDTPPHIHIYIYIYIHEIYIFIYIYIYMKYIIHIWNIYIYIHIYHHHHVPQARISLTLSHHFSLSFIASGKSSVLHPISSHSCCMYVRAGRRAFARSCVGVHRSTSLMSSSLLLQQCLAYLVRLTSIAFVMEGRWPYSWCPVECCHQDLFNIARNILI